MQRVQPQYDINDISENQKLYLYKYLAKVETKSIQDLGQQSESCELCNFPLIWKILQETLTNDELLQILKKHTFKASCAVIFNNETLQDELVKLFDINKIKQLEIPFKESGFKYITIDIEGYRQSGETTSNIIKNLNTRKNNKNDIE